MKQNRKEKGKKHIRLTVVLCALAVCLLLGGCMNTDNNGTQTPEAEDTERPEMSFTPQNTQAVRNEASSTTQAPFDWRQNAARIEERINMISEIQSSRVVVSEGTALVGVVFTEAYQGELTQRIHDMVAAEIQSVDPQVQTVAVTAEPQDVERISRLADRILSGTPVSELETEIDSIVRNMTTIQ